MKYTLLVFFSVILFIPFCANAQSSGWVWGQGNTGAGIDAYAVATDALGNVYGAGINYMNTSSTFGSITLPNSSVSGTAGGMGNIQSVWIKYSSTGTPLWAAGTQNSDDWLIT